MQQIESPLIKVSEASKFILLEQPAATYDKIRRGVFPAGVVIHLGERSMRFHREKLLRWLESGGSRSVEGNNGAAQSA